MSKSEINTAIHHLNNVSGATSDYTELQLYILKLFLIEVSDVNEITSIILDAIQVINTGINITLLTTLQHKLSIAKSVDGSLNNRLKDLHKMMPLSFWKSVAEHKPIVLRTKYTDRDLYIPSSIFYKLGADIIVNPNTQPELDKYYNKLNINYHISVR